jgi:hypothetical protein
MLCGKEASWHQQNSKVWSLGCVVTESWHCVAVKGACGAARPANLNRLVPTGSRGPGVYLLWGISFQEPQQLLHVQENKACKKQEFGA